MNTLQTNSEPAKCCSLWSALATVIALVALAGSLYLSMGMNLKACPLCFYQRTFVMGVVGVLIIGSLARNAGGVISLLALPMAVGGLTIAGYHTYLEATGVLECPQGVAHLGSAPQQSLAIHVVLVLVLALDVVMLRQAVPALAATVLGVLLAGGAIMSLPSTVIPDYNRSVDEDGCRKRKS